MNVTTFVDVLDQITFEVAFVESYPDWCSWCDHSQSGWGSLGTITFWTFLMLSRAAFDHIDGLFRQKTKPKKCHHCKIETMSHTRFEFLFQPDQVEQTNSVTMLVVFLANFLLVLFECFWNYVVDLYYKCKTSSLSWLAWAYALSRFGWVTDVIEISKICIFWWFKPRNMMHSNDSAVAWFGPRTWFGPVQGPKLLYWPGCCCDSNGANSAQRWERKRLGQEPNGPHSQCGKYPCLVGSAIGDVPLV